MCLHSSNGWASDMNRLALAFEPLVSWPLLAAVAVPALLLALYALARRRRGAAIRFAALALLAGALANPVLLSEERESLKSIVAVVVDRSPSQEIGDRTAATDAALAALKARLEAMPGFETRIVETGRAANGAEKAETRLFTALEGALSDVPPSRVGGAIMITDGQVHDLPAAGSGLPDGAPLHALVTGNEGERDRRVRFITAPRFGIVGKPLDMTFRIEDGAAAGERVTVRIRVNGDQVEQVDTVVGRDTTVAIVPPTAGRAIVEILVEPLEAEISTLNNRAIALVDGIRDNLRVLLVSGEPHAGERTWRNLLKSDASVDLVHFTILRPPEKQDGTPVSELSLIAFPTHELFVEKIKDFDLIIFDRYQHRDVLPVLYYDYIAQYVEGGGALLVASGPEYAGRESLAGTPLAPVLPAEPTGEVVEEAFRPALTDDGRRHPVTRALEGADTTPPRWSRWFRQVEVAAPDGDVVMKGVGEAPLLVLARKGEGRVGLLLSDQGWLWARGFEGGGPHVQLYRRLAHWLMKEPELEEERLTAEGRGMTVDIRRQTMDDKALPARVILPSGKVIDVPLSSSGPGLFTGTLLSTEVGLHQVGNGDLSTLVHVGPADSPEYADAVSTTAGIEPAARSSGGSVRRLSAGMPSLAPARAGAAMAGRDWIGLRLTGDSRLKSVERLPLFSGVLGLALLLAALSVMWWREGR